MMETPRAKFDQLTLWLSADPLLHLDHPVPPLVGLGLGAGLQAFPHDPRSDLRVLDVAEIEWFVGFRACCSNLGNLMGTQNEMMCVCSSYTSF